MSDTRLCQIESMENAAEKRFDEMDIDGEHFKCGCGRIEKWCNANTATPNPYSQAICGHCMDEIIEGMKAPRHTPNEDGSKP